jgi:hypothetical protein
MGRMVDGAGRRGWGMDGAWMLERANASDVKLQGDDRSFHGHVALLQAAYHSDKDDSSSSIGQLNDYLRHQQNESVPNIDQTSKTNLELLMEKRDPHQGDPHTWNTEYSDGQTEQTGEKRRLFNCTGDIGQGFETTGNKDRHRLVRKSEEQEVSTICDNQQTRRSSRKRCFQHGMEDLLSTHTPSHPSHSEVSSKTERREGEGSSVTSSMARTGVDESTAQHDSERSEPGREQRNPDTGKIDDTMWDRITSGDNKGMPHGRVNQDGWEYWDTIIATVNANKCVQQKLKQTRSDGSQRTHCAALARFCRVCDHLNLKKEMMDSFETLVEIAVEAMSWAVDSGAKIYRIKAMRTALSVLFNYRFNRELSDNPLVKSIVRACELTQLIVKEPLQLKWKLPDLLTYIRDMPPNATLSYGKLQRKCSALVMTNTTARYAEIAQFMVTAKEPKGKEKEWKFYIQIKGKECLQPVALHQTVDSRLNPIIAMKVLKQRMISRKWIKRNKLTGLFW